MLQLEHNDHLPPAVHFTLRSPAAEMKKNVILLNVCARKIGFKKVSQVFHLIGDMCEVRENDSLHDFKIHSRYNVILPEGVISIMPSEIFGFEITLPNDNSFYIGLCRYPQSVSLEDRKLPVKVTGTQWMSYVRTVKTVQTALDECFESHIRVLMLLTEAEKLGILTSINDPYKQWRHADVDVFEDICSQQKDNLIAH